MPEASAFPVVVRRGRATIISAAPIEVVVADGVDALGCLDRLTPGWWAGFLTYDLGRAVEHVRPRLERDATLPDLVLARYDARLVIDDAGAHLEGDARARGHLDRLLEGAPAPRALAPVGAPSTSLDRDAFEAGVRSVIALIEAGDCYQVNLTRRLTWDTAVDPVALHHALGCLNPAPHEGLFVLPGPSGPIAVVSASPERFLAWRGPDCETRPIKGTAIDDEWLRASPKDRAENVMIVDLARNDLGRVCDYGSVQVPELLGIEEHPGLVHLVSTVRGRRRAGVGPGALVRATFPPASVTGAPKPRVLQAIEDLEPVRRGIYCGAIGWIDTERDEADLAVAIRTFTISGGRTMLGVGGGIVADSDPAAEWAETELKAARLLDALGAPPTAGRAA
ncbi:MAG: anthranilate synthase component I family protein [Acidimicrobiia bacterium]